MTAAALVTWIVATGTAAFTALFTLVFLEVAVAMFDAFVPDLAHPRLYLLSAAVLVVVLCAAADLAALFMVRGNRKAWLVLIQLSVAAVVCSLVAAVVLAPLVLTVASAAVIVLLLRPSSRAWFADSPDAAG